MRKLLLIITLLTLFFIFQRSASAFEKTTFVSIVNPVTGMEGWNGGNQTPLDLPAFQYQEATKSALPITWLLRFDIVNNATYSANFKDLIATDSSQTLGAYLEITPKLAESAKVVYPDGDYISQPHRIFLSGYAQEDRLRLIDTYMANFFDQFGFYPKSVGAWYIDSYSLEYLAKKYSVLAAVICDEQYTTDNYRLWGAYLGSPYYPNKTNTLLPANNSENKINLAITKWAMRDPFNFYGTAGSSSFSVQINDYLFHNQKTDYFDRLLEIYSDKKFNEFTQVVIGLENGYPISQYRQEIKNVYQLLKQRQGKYNLKFIQLDQFGDWFKARYPESSPAFVYRAIDPTGGTNGEVLWYQNPYYRIGLKKIDNQTKIIDFRLYHQKEAEPYYLSPNTEKTLFAETPNLIDSVKYKNSAISLDFDLNVNNLQFIKDSWIFSATDSAKTITFEPRRIIFSGLNAPTLDSQEIKIKEENKKTIWEINPTIPFDEFQKGLFANVIKIGLVFFLLLWFFKMKIKRISTPVFLVSLVSIFITLITVVKSGLIYPFGLGFWGPNGHDAIFHLSLINSFRQSPLGFNNPQLAGFELKNYHFGFDYISAIFSRLFNISPIDTYFRYLPLLIAIFIVISTLSLISLWKYSKTAKIFSLIILFLAGSLGFLPRLITNHNLFSGESAFWANQSISLLLNPPFALSLIILIAFFYLFEKTKNNRSIGNLLLLGLIGGALVQIKIYAFILLAISLFLHRQFKSLILTALFGLLFILPSLKLSSSPFVFQPFWFLETMIAAPDRLNLRFLAEAWQVYQNSGQLLKLALVNFAALIIFIIGNLGIRTIGLYQVIFKNHPLSSQKIIKTIIILGIIIPLIFVQQQNPWNIIQFLYYSLFFLGLFTGEQLANWLKDISRRYLVLVLILLSILTFTTTIGSLRDYLSSQSSSRISFVELRALDLLKKQSSGVVISPLYKPFPKIKVYDPRPLYAYTSTAYISALSGQREYLSDTINLDITGFDYQERSKLVQRFYNTKYEIWAKKFLLENQITYIYENPITRLQFNPEDIGAEKIFDSGEINIYKFNRHD